MIKLTILGASGSIGRQALEVCRWRRGEISIAALTVGRDWQNLAAAAREFRPALVACADESAYQPLKRELSGLGMEILTGEEGLAAAAAYADADTVLAAISGMAGLRPLLAAIDAGKRIALANKESLVAAGQIICGRAAERRVSILPVDSEHSAIWQCLQGEEASCISRLILTASGGAFRDWSAERMATATTDDALRHPNWAMGPKITVDSATLANKALEVIEAHWLFGVDYERIDILIHPESIVHSLVEFTDGSVKAQLGQPDMRLPIQYALCGAGRPACPAPKLDLALIGQLRFSQPDYERFPVLPLLLAAARAGGSAPACLNAVNEEAVLAFLRGEIKFGTIARCLEQALSVHRVRSAADFESVFAADREGRELAARFIRC